MIPLHPDHPLGRRGPWGAAERKILLANACREPTSGNREQFWVRPRAREQRSFAHLEGASRCAVERALIDFDRACKGRASKLSARAIPIVSIPPPHPRQRSSQAHPARRVSAQTEVRSRHPKALALIDFDLLQALGPARYAGLSDPVAPILPPHIDK